jgi:ABC-2 type transport system ATP-binding protein
MQDAALDGLMTGREHMELVGGLWGLSGKDARRRSDELLDKFGLAGAGRRLISTYSGGMRRRLDIATALIDRPRILFLDEPTTGLDPQSRRALWQEIKQLRKDGATVFLTTQYIEEADELADRIAVINDGRIVACGSPEELKSDLGRTLVEVRLTDEGQVTELRQAAGEAPLTILPDNWVRVELSGNGTASPVVLDMLGRLRDAGVGIERLSVTEPSLEDIFVQLTSDELEQRASGSNGTDDGAGIAQPELVTGGGS